MSEQSAEKITLGGALAALSVGLVLTVVISEGIVRLTMPHWREFYNGWFMERVIVPGHGIVTTGRPGFNGYFSQNNGDFRVKIEINDAGLRNPDPVQASAGRIWFIGDSMAFGWGVKQQEMYSSVVGSVLGEPTYNVASPGTDVCGYQALFARMPKEAVPRAVVVGLILENDIRLYDCGAAARRAEVKGLQQQNETPTSAIELKIFLTRVSALYNFFAVVLKRVDVVREIFTKVGIIRSVRELRGVIPSDRVDESVSRTIHEITRLRAMLAPGTPFVVLVAPGRAELSGDNAYYRTIRLKIDAALKARGIPFVDPIGPFVKAGYRKIHFVHDGHWAPLGHRLAGELISRWLRDNLPPK